MSKSKEYNSITNETNYNTINYLENNNIKFNKMIKNKDTIKDNFTIDTQSNKKGKNFLKDHIEKKIKRHKILCHRFTDNPQHFYTVKLTEAMIKELIKIKNKNEK